MTRALPIVLLLAVARFPGAPARHVPAGSGEVPLFYSSHRGDVRRGRVLLLSGAGSTWRVLDGLTDYLTRRGYDVWEAGVPEKADFDDFVERGMPSVLEAIPGRPYWVGYDAGGLAALAYLSAAGEGRMSRGVCIACPVAPEMPYTAVTRALAALRSRPREPDVSRALLTLLLANDGLEAGELGRFLSGMSSRALMRDAVRWYETGHWRSSDGTRDYAAALGRVGTPVFFLSGQADTVVPPWMTYPGYTAVSSKKKLFRLFGRVNGYTREFGHLGLLLGEGARREVYPAIAQWLERGNVTYAWQEDLPF